MERKWWTLIVACLATFMLLLDITVVNVALPDIQSSLHASFSDLQWVVDAYALTLAALLLTAGSLGDRIGRKLVFAVGLGLFVAASLLCGLATTPTFLNLARALQGVGGAVMFAQSLALIAEDFHGRERGTAFGIWGATIGAAVAVGPLVGGVLTEGIGWEWIFFVNIPIGIATIALTMRFVHESRDEAARRLDIPGTILFSGALFALVFALIRGNAEGWGSTLIVGLLLGAVALLALFVAVERRIDDPMFDLSLFRVPAFCGVSIAAFALSSSMFAMFLYLTLYVQNILGFSPLEAGLRFLPITLISFFVAPIAGQLTARIQVRYLLGAGLLLVAIGLALMHGVGVGLELDHAAPGLPARAASGSACATPRSRRSRSASWRPRRAAWPPASAPRSARSASPRASPASARSSSHACRTRRRRRSRARPASARRASATRWRPAPRRPPSTPRRRACAARWRARPRTPSARASTRSS